MENVGQSQGKSGENYHPFTGRIRKRESKPIAPWKIFPPVYRSF